LSKRSPWTYIPLLYFLQAVPVTVVQELATIVYKDLGIANESIIRWTSLIALPWSLQMLFGPLVELNFTKRWWIQAMQLLIAVGLAASAFLIRLPQAFEFTLIVFGASAVMSALCNTATDGFAIMAMDKTEQAQFAGIMSTFYRLGRLFCISLLVFIAGMLMKLPALPISVQGGTIAATLDNQPATVATARLTVINGLLGTEDGAILSPTVPIPPGSFGLKVEPNGDVFVTRLTGVEKAGTIALPQGATIPGEGSVQGLDPRTTWMFVLLIGAAVYALLYFVMRGMLPRPESDVPRNEDRGEVRASIARTLYLIGLGLGGYFLLNAVVRLVAHGIWASQGADPEGPLKGWMVGPANTIPFLGGLSPTGLTAELAQLVVCAAVVAGSAFLARKTIRGTETGEALASFVRQPGFLWIFFFVLFYRFPEAMVGKVSSLFLKDALDKGGLALPNEQIGVIGSLVGVVGIIVGGILGGWVVSRVGLRKAFWPLALAMHLPNLLYLWASYGTMHMVVLPLKWPGPLNLTIGGVAFIDQMGYGFGYAAYMVYLMRVAQRGNYRTAHYAIGTGMGALCILTAGVTSGVIQANFGYKGVFLAVMFASIPGLLSLLKVPMDDPIPAQT
jgi:PAT family beta-lactamase induction signal transducer AmpG